MSRPIGTAAELQRRRTRAAALLEQGEKPRVVARVLGARVKSLRRWRRMAQQRAGLESAPHKGPEPGLCDEQLRRPEALLLRGPKHHGWHNELRAAGRVAVPVERHFGRRY